MQFTSSAHLSGTQDPELKVAPPGPKSSELAQRLIRCESPGVSSIAQGKIPIFWEEAKGANVRDVDGNIYLDLTAAFAVASLGHSNDAVVKAIQQQAEILIHGQGAIHPCLKRVQLVEKLRNITPAGLEKSIILSTGAEAVEVAIKTARLFTGKRGIIAFHGGFHGKTFGALGVTSKKSYRQPFSPLVPGSAHVPYAYCYRCVFGHTYPECDLKCVDYLKYILDDPATAIDEIGALIVEPIQGHEGWIVPPDDFLKSLRRICSERGIVMIADEIITGFGRTGEWFGINHSGITPDIIVIGKGMGGGFPISAAVGRSEIMDAWRSSTGESVHSSTFLGNPLGCAACLAGIKEIEDKSLVERSSRLGQKLMKELLRMQTRHQIIGDVRGKGLLIGLELVKDRRSKDPAAEATAFVVSNALKNGLIINSGGKFNNVIKLSPPLVITEEQLGVGLEIIEKCITLAEKESKK